MAYRIVVVLVFGAPLSLSDGGAFFFT